MLGTCVCVDGLVMSVHMYTCVGVREPASERESHVCVHMGVCTCVCVCLCAYDMLATCVCVDVLVVCVHMYTCVGVREPASERVSK